MLALVSLVSVVSVLSADVVLPPAPNARHLSTLGADDVDCKNADGSACDDAAYVEALNSVTAVQRCVLPKHALDDVVTATLTLAPTGVPVQVKATVARPQAHRGAAPGAERRCVEDRLSSTSFPGAVSLFALTPARTSPAAPLRTVTVRWRVVDGETDGVFGFTRREIADVILKNGGSVLRCYGKALSTTPTLAGTLVLRIRTNIVAEVESVDVVKADNDGVAGLAPCVGDAARGWRFSKVDGRTLDVTFPFVFEVVADAAPTTPTSSAAPSR